MWLTARASNSSVATVAARVVSRLDLSERWVTGPLSDHAVYIR
jgi:hypothetical protein